MSAKFPVLAYIANPRDEFFMRLALQQARLACNAGEVPIGAVVCHKEEILGQSRNSTIENADPTAHAEMKAIQTACLKTKSCRLAGATLYVNLQPCLMCLGAIAHARIGRVVIGAGDSRFSPKLEKSLALFEESAAWQGCKFEQGCLAQESSTLLQQFFQNKRPDRTQTLLQIGPISKLPNVNKSVAHMLEGCGFFTGSDFVKVGLPVSLETIQNLLGTLQPDQHANDIAILKSVCDFLEGKPNSSWKTYLDPQEP